MPRFYATHPQVKDLLFKLLYCMTRLLMTLGVGMVLGVACFAQSSPEADTMFMPNLIEVNVGATKTAKREAPKVEMPAPEPMLTREEVINRVNNCEQQATVLYSKLDNYRDLLHGSRKKLILKTTGYYKPSVLRGADEVRADASRLCKNLNQEIVKIQSTSLLSQREQASYISRLEMLKGSISKETEKIAELMIRKLKL